jgi:hypothetical protein
LGWSLRVGGGDREKGCDDEKRSDDFHFGDLLREGGYAKWRTRGRGL